MSACICYKCLHVHTIGARVTCADCKACAGSNRECLRKRCPQCNAGTYMAAAPPATSRPHAREIVAAQDAAPVPASQDDARDAERYRVIRECLADNLEFLHFSDEPDEIDRICDAAILGIKGGV